MNKLVLGIVMVAVIAVALGTAGFVYAQGPTPQAPIPGSGYGPGMGNGRGNRGGMMAGQGFGPGDQDGFLHDGIIASFAQQLGISVDDLNARLANGETMAQIALSKGFTAEQFTTLMSTARSQAIDQAVKAGTLTQAQADWMKQRGAGMNGTARGFGAGRGMGMNGTCPYLSTTTP